MNPRLILALLIFVGGFLIGVAVGYRRAEREIARPFPTPVVCIDSLTAWELELLARALKEYGDVSEDLSGQWKRKTAQ